MQYCNFKVDKKPYCCWEENLKKRNLSFIDAFDTSYFRYNANLHREQLNSEDKQNSAFSLRLLYHHIIETLFTLVCASLQAPKCLYGWIQKSSIKDVRKITKLINSGSKDIFNLIGLNEVSWEAYSSKVFYIDENWSEGLKNIVASYALFLSRLSYDFNNEYSIKEYNSMKHGFRLRKGGFRFTIKPINKTESNNGRNAHILGYSEFGSSFYVLEEIKNFTSRKYPHYQSRNYALNWNPENIYHTIIIASYALENILAFLRIWNGEEKASFQSPTDKDYFKLPWKDLSGIMNINQDVKITKDMIEHTSKDEINNRLKKIWKK